MQQSSSLWLQQDRWQGLPALDRDLPADVAVVGAGVTGCACALALAEHGRQPVVLEADRVAAGASGRNGGFAGPGSGVDLPAAAALIGGPAALELVRATASAVDDMLALAARGGATGAVRRTGSLWLAAEDEAAGLAVAVRELAAAGVDCREAPQLIPEPMRGHFVTAAHTPAACSLQPARWTQALAAAATERGAAVFEGSPVRGIERAGGGWLLRTPSAAVTARAVVVALDGLSARLLGELEGIVYPVRGQMLATEPLPDTVIGMPIHSDHGFFYLQPTADGRLVAGGGRLASLEAEYTAELAVTPPVQAAIQRYLSERMGLGGAPVSHRWAGIMGFSADRLPVAGELPGRPGLYVAAGYSGVGNVQGWVCGRLVADLVCGLEHPLAGALSPARFAAGGALRAPPSRAEQVESRALAGGFARFS
jgi:gamma-glutamylputrescine oxidase